MTYSIDIETMSNLEVIHLLPDVEPAKNLKDPEKIKTDIQDKKQKQIDDMALSPLYGKIACIGIYSPNEQYCLFGTEEKIITEFLEFIGKKTIYTWNGQKFDLDFIAKRAIINGTHTFKDFEVFRERYSIYHKDIMVEWAGYNQRAHLNDVAKIVLGESKLDFDFREIPELLKTKEGRNEIRKYCLHDCKLTYDLAKKLGF